MQRGKAFERHLRLERYVVREHHHVEPALQRFARLGGSEVAGHRDERQIRLRLARKGRVKRARLAQRLELRGRRLDQQALGERQRRSGIGSAHGDQQVIGLGGLAVR